MGASIEFLIIRALPGSLAQDPKHITGGRPKYSAADIQMIHACVPPHCWDAMFARHGDHAAGERLVNWLQRQSRESWVESIVNANVAHTVRNLDRIAEVVVIKYICPRNSKGELWTDEWAAKYVAQDGPSFSLSTWQRRFRNHQRNLERRLDLLWEEADSALTRFVHGREETEAACN